MQRVCPHPSRQVQTVHVIVSWTQNVYVFLGLETSYRRVAWLFYARQKLSIQVKTVGEFPGSALVKTLCFHCQVLGSIPGRGAKIPQAVRHRQKIKKKQVQSVEATCDDEIFQATDVCPLTKRMHPSRADFFFWLHCAALRDLSAPTRDRTRVPCSGSVESQPLDCQGSP